MSRTAVPGSVPKFWLVAVSLFLFALCLISVVLLTKNEEERELRYEAELLVRNVLDALQERERVFRDPILVASGDCSEASLATFRETLFGFTLLTDIVVFEEAGDAILCSATMGVLKEPHVVVGREIESLVYLHRQIIVDVRLPFLPQVAGHHLERSRRIGVILDPKRARGHVPDHRWQVYSVDLSGAFIAHVHGNPMLRELAARNTLTSFFWATVTHCNKDLGVFCVVTANSPLSVARNQRVMIVLGGLTSLCIAVLFYLVSKRFLEKRLSVSGRILRALRHQGKGFACHYQPIIDMNTGRVAGCEVLARFEDEYGRLSPLDFIHVIEREGKSWAFTEMLFRIVLRELESLGSLPDGFRLSLNFYPADLCDENLQRIKGCGALAGLRQRNIQIVCEILETGMGHGNGMVETFRWLKQAGLDVAIDDFGTGYSNLQQLQQVDADYLKIDKSFTDEIDPARKSVKGSFFRHIVAIGEEAGIAMIAAGVETPAQVQALAAYGIPYAQGYYFSRPVPAVEFAKIIGHCYPVSANSQVAATARS